LVILQDVRLQGSARSNREHRLLDKILIFSALTVFGAVPAAGESALSSEQETLARRLLNSQGCKACHQFEGGTTEIGPTLREASRGLTRKELTRSLVNPENSHGDGLIPAFSHLTPEEVKALVAFLRHLEPEE